MSGAEMLFLHRLQSILSGRISMSRISFFARETDGKAGVL
ncbi:hypothetical protein CHCC20335_2475 [Bacillus paralicheniformis]|nr:hypothetical protein CHCC20335_2475 [Bacillus paralicheniformis]